VSRDLATPGANKPNLHIANEGTAQIDIVEPEIKLPARFGTLRHSRRLGPRRKAVESAPQLDEQIGLDVGLG
jgi:hypothetical protein